MKSLASATLACLLLGGLACDRRVEPYVPPEQEPAPTAQPVRIPGLNSPAPRRTAPPLSADSGLRGTLRLADGAVVPESGVLFVIARSGSGGPPLAVKRLPLGSFPTAFEIGPADVMIQGRPFEGPIRLSARIDEDGDPMTRGAKDLRGESPDLLEPGTTGVEIELAR